MRLEFTISQYSEDVLQPNVPLEIQGFCKYICSLSYWKILSYQNDLKNGRNVAKGHKMCVCVEIMISIPQRGFILPNVSSTWSRLRAQGHSMMGLIRASLEVEEPCQRGVCLTRLCSPPLPLPAIRPPGRFPHWKRLPESRRPEMTAPQRLWLKNTNLGFPIGRWRRLNVQEKSIYLSKTSDSLSCFTTTRLPNCSSKISFWKKSTPKRLMRTGLNLV